VHLDKPQTMRIPEIFGVEKIITVRRFFKHSGTQKKLHFLSPYVTVVMMVCFLSHECMRIPFFLGFPLAVLTLYLTPGYNLYDLAAWIPQSKFEI
jgi:hypothetical protein